MHPEFKAFLLSITQATDCRETELIQRLWSDYGHIARCILDDSLYSSVVVKCIALKRVGSHPRGWNDEFSHQRKLNSYQVETEWYKQWSKKCTDAFRVPQFIGDFAHGVNQWIVMEDLDTHFPKRISEPTLDEVKLCLRWLANFHMHFLNSEPKGLWQEGSYWHLKTRPHEFAKIENDQIKQKAYLIDEVLKSCRFQTLVHGDAKLANFCFSADGMQVAAVDFQYVGGGCGMKDVNYLLRSCLDENDLYAHEADLLDYYFEALAKAHQIASLNGALKPDGFDELETEWRKLYPYASADFTRFLLGWMPTHHKINEHAMNTLNSVLMAV